MTIRSGAAGAAVKEMFLGAQAVQEVWLGTTQIFPANTTGGIEDEGDVTDTTVTLDVSET